MYICTYVQINKLTFVYIMLLNIIYILIDVHIYILTCTYTFLTNYNKLLISPTILDISLAAGLSGSVKLGDNPCIAASG